MPDTPNDNNSTPENDSGDFEVDLFQRITNNTSSPFTRRLEPPPPPPKEDPIEEYWATFGMITHTGERFNITACFRNRGHYNAEMHKFDTAKNIHIVLRDINDESIVIKRDQLLHVLPATLEEIPEKKKW